MKLDSRKVLLHLEQGYTLKLRMGSIFPSLKTCPQHLLLPKLCIHIQTDKGLQRGRQKKANQSRKSGERNHPGQKTGLELCQQEWEEIKAERIWQRPMENISARKTVGQKVWDKQNN